jgi:hypothetical protein
VTAVRLKGTVCAVLEGMSSVPVETARIITKDLVSVRSFFCPVLFCEAKIQKDGPMVRNGGEGRAGRIEDDRCHRVSAIRCQVSKRKLYV